MSSCWASLTTDILIHISEYLIDSTTFRSKFPYCLLIASREIRKRIINDNLFWECYHKRYFKCFVCKNDMDLTSKIIGVNNRLWYELTKSSASGSAIRRQWGMKFSSRVFYYKKKKKTKESGNGNGRPFFTSLALDDEKSLIDHFWNLERSTLLEENRSSCHCHSISSSREVAIQNDSNSFCPWQKIASPLDEIHKSVSCGRSRNKATFRIRLFPSFSPPGYSRNNCSEHYNHEAQALIEDMTQSCVIPLRKSRPFPRKNTSEDLKWFHRTVYLASSSVPPVPTRDIFLAVNVVESDGVILARVCGVALMNKSA